jgi:hypothetical protein
VVQKHCYYNTAHPQVVDAGESLQIGRVAVNILSSCGQLTRVGPPAKGLGGGGG